VKRFKVTWKLLAEMTTLLLLLLLPVVTCTPVAKHLDPLDLVETSLASASSVPAWPVSYCLLSRCYTRQDRPITCFFLVRS
jgi:hypothetical protein